MNKLLLITLGITLIACGGRKSDSSGAAKDVDAFAANAGLEKFECDGEGTELSGSYNFNYTNSTQQCTPAGAPMAKKDSEEPAAYSCKQKNKEFVCVSADKPDASQLNGCINKDGRYKLTLVPNPNGAKMQESLNMQAKGYMIGTLGKADGKAQYNLAMSGRGQEVKCVSTSDVEVTQVK